jgi:hypothetical protein
VHSHAIVSEPAGDVYLSLLAFAERHSSRFSLVWRRGLKLDADAEAIKAALKPFQEKAVETSEWPGTQLIGQSAMVRMYRFAPESTRMLAAANRLFAWQSPARPEDLAFYTADGRCWFGSIAHEREAFVVLDAADLSALCAAVPGLQLAP